MLLRVIKIIYKACVNSIIIWKIKGLKVLEKSLTKLKGKERKREKKKTEKKKREEVGSLRHSDFPIDGITPLK